VTLLVPLNDNDGQPFDLPTWSGEVSALRRLLIEARHRFKQRAMYLEYHRVYFEEVE